MRHFIIVALFSSLMQIAVVRAAVTEFTIDSDQSQITAAGEIAGFTVREQGAGSLTSSLMGKILAEVTDTSITFPGGSVLDVVENGTWQPAPGGGSGSAPADFAGAATVIFATARGAFRNIVLDVTSSSLGLNNGAFDSSALLFSFVEEAGSALDYDAILDRGSETLTGISANGVTTSGTLATEGPSLKLTIQIDTTHSFSALSDDDSSIHLTGQIVATSGTPLVIGSAVFSADNLSITVDDTDPALHLEGSTNLVDWTDRVAERAVVDGKTVFTIDMAGGFEFIRAVK